MKFTLKNLEDKLQSFFEEQLTFITNNDPLHRLSRQFLISLKDNLQNIDDKTYLPNILRISIKDENFLNSSQLESWKNFLHQVITDMSRTDNLDLPGPVHIQFFYDQNLNDDFLIETDHSVFTSGKTIKLPNDYEVSSIFQKPINAYLIKPDDTIFAIEKNIINIGRNEENDLIIDNLRVSRMHAQLRTIKSKHIIFDLDSTTGIKVNGNRVNQMTLSQGDVIEIGDVPLIYNMELPEDQVVKMKDTTKFINPPNILE